MFSSLSQFYAHCLSLDISASLLKHSRWITKSEEKALDRVKSNLNLILSSCYIPRDKLTNLLADISLQDLYLDPKDKEAISIFKAKVDSLDLYKNSYSKHIKEIKTYASILKSP